MNRKEAVILKAHKLGLTDRQIGKANGWHHHTVGYWRKKHNLPSNGTARQPLEFVSATEAKCSKCSEIKLAKEFLYNRRGQKYEYRFSYCLSCRRKQLNANVNSSIDKFLKNRLTRLRVRAAKHNIPFDLDGKWFINQYNRQNGKCFYTDTVLRCRQGEGNSPDSFSVDKIIPEFGYLRNNVVFCTHQVNTMKYNSTLEFMRSWMRPWYNRVMKHKKSLGE